MQNNENFRGHLFALISALIWGTTFVASKTLLKSFLSFEILFFRFFLAFVVLFLLHPKTIKTKDRKEELLFVLAGFTGVTLYFGLEVTALNYTTASNVGIIVSVSPFFTAIFAKIFLKENSINRNFVLGFLVALIGIVLISTQGDFNFKINLLGDILAFLSAICWAIYSLISKKISTLGYNGIAITRRIFFYGLLFMLPIALVSGFSWDISRFKSPVNILSLLYLGLGASALCFLTWGVAIKVLGAVKTSVYIYLVPIVSVLSSAVMLNEVVTLYSIVGIVLILIGLILSERRRSEKTQ